MSTFTILHMSDIHLLPGSKDSYLEDKVLKLLLTRLKHEAIKGRKADVIFFTGDLADKGEDYFKAEIFFDELLNVTGLIEQFGEMAKQRLFIVPGNHDVDRNKTKFKIRTLNDIKESTDFFAPNSIKDREGIFSRFHAYEEFFNRYFDGIRKFNLEQPFYAEILDLDEIQIRLGIVGLNSAWFSQDREDAGKLWIGERICEEAFEILESMGEADINIVTHHHPYSCLHKDERQTIKKLITEKADICLYGHLHEPETQQIKNQYGEVLNFQSGAACDHSEHPYYRILWETIDINSGKVHVLPMAYHEKPTPSWTLDTTLFPDEPDYIKVFDLVGFHPKEEKNVGPLEIPNSQLQLSEIKKKQRQFILNLSILPWTPSPGLGFIWPKLFIEPRIHPRKYPGRPEIRLDAWLKEYDWESDIAIIGPPGIGKSTTLHAIFLKLIESDKSLQCQYIPVLTTASEILEFRKSKYQSLIEYIGLRFGVQISDSIFSDLSKRLLLLVDGLDEVDESDIPLVLDSLKHEIPKNTVKWIACRDEIFNRNIAIKRDLDGLFNTLELLEWDENTDSLEFISKYAEHTQQQFLYDRFVSLNQRNPEIRSFLKNPFELTLLLFLFSDEKSAEESNFANSYSLYSAFYDNWIEREHHRGTAEIPPEIVSEAHRNLASNFHLFKKRGIDLSDFINDLSRHFVLSDFIKDTSFLDLLIIEKVPGTSRLKVEKFWHETIGEFLIAKGIISAFEKGGTNLYDTLNLIYNYKINVFVRGAFECINNRERTNILKNLENLYVELFPLNPETKDTVINEIQQATNSKIVNPDIVNNSEEATRIREQILYYIANLPFVSFPEVIRFGYYNEPNSLVSRMAALGAILHGDESIEDDFFNRLIPGSLEDVENRSVQLVYFGDVDGDIHSYIDDGKVQWTWTRNAIYHRLKLNSQREMRLRRWHIRTLYLFFDSRGWSDYVTEIEIENFRRTNIECKEFSENKKIDISFEKDQLIERLRSILKTESEDE